ncbi:hypothetical protein [Paenibacillus sp. 32352]|uniref:hypothetical protein n=1 Tax=Paenibacillus sp. 32352 TaxID=1969111 RepID=UPI0009AD1511|nr:hypothetical protein [Paenibacillus sp. 32352]
MKQRMMIYEPAVPVLVDAGQELKLKFQMDKAGLAEFALTAACDGDWLIEGKESVLLQVLLNGEYNQVVVLFYGDRWLKYPRLLGYLEPGDYELELRFHEQSSPGTRQAAVKAAAIYRVDRDSSLGMIYRYAPMLYGRDLGHPVESRYTDTPLLMLYTLTQGEDRTVIEYHVLYSHEDEGTPAPMLMSKWGRLTDIEWTLRIVLGRDGKIIETVYQGLHHRTTPFRGEFVLGGHPALQSASAHGMVTDVPTSRYRMLLAPVYCWNPAIEPRERVMDAYPYTYQMMAWELERHRRLSQVIAMGTGSEPWQVTDVREYLFVQTSKWAEDPALQNRTCVDIRVRLKGSTAVYSSSFGDLRAGEFRAAYTGPYEWFATTVKLPAGTVLGDIEAIEAELLGGGDHAVTVRGLKAFMLEADYLPGDAVETLVELRLTVDEPVGSLWCAP